MYGLCDILDKGVSSKYHMCFKLGIVFREAGLAEGNFVWAVFWKTWDERLLTNASSVGGEEIGTDTGNGSPLEHSLTLSYHFHWLGSSIHAWFVLGTERAESVYLGLESLEKIRRLSRSLGSKGLHWALQNAPISKGVGYRHITVPVSSPCPAELSETLY